MRLGNLIRDIVDKAYTGKLVPGLTLSATVSVKRVTGQSYDTATGVNMNTYSTTSTLAIVRDITLKEVELSGGMFHQGDIMFKLQATAALSSVTDADEVIHLTRTYRIMNVLDRRLEGDALIFDVVGRRV